MSQEQALAAGQKLADRLTVWKRLAEQCKDRGDEGEWIDIRDLWNPADQAALEAFEALLNHLKGRAPLPFQPAAATAFPQEVAQ